MSYRSKRENVSVLRPLKTVQMQGGA
jgi:hypothetical protein